jgi:GH25 family lysozyme M1 (1,4-beta-N-acetylmuramidase)
MILGIDCASVDENVNPDWVAARTQASIKFVFLRATHGTTPDSMFAKEWPAVKSAGLTRGAYMFLCFPHEGRPVPSPEAQAKAFLEVVGPLDRGDLPGTIDVEFPGGRSATTLTAQEAIDWVRAACNVVAAQGTAPIIYTSGRAWREDLDNLDAPDLVESPLWLAHYWCKPRQPAQLDTASLGAAYLDPPIPRPWGDRKCFFAQYQGDALGVPGMSSTVDLSCFNVPGEGEHGGRVTWLQRRLGIAPSGTFDTAMTSAVIEYQRAHELEPDGIIGPRTFAGLCWEQPA